MLFVPGICRKVNIGSRYYEFDYSGLESNPLFPATSFILQLGLVEYHLLQEQCKFFVEGRFIQHICMDVASYSQPLDVAFLKVCHDAQESFLFHIVIEIAEIYPEASYSRTISRINTLLPVPGMFKYHWKPKRRPR